MSAVVVLTPIVIASWPALTAAVAGAAAAMGFAVSAEQTRAAEKAMASAEAEIEEAEVVAEGLQPGQSVVLQRDNVTIEIRQDAGGRCRVCARGAGHSKRELQAMADDVAGRVVQQFVYHKLLTELQNRNGEVLHQERLADDSVRVHVRL